MYVFRQRADQHSMQLPTSPSNFASKDAVAGCDTSRASTSTGKVGSRYFRSRCRALHPGSPQIAKVLQSAPRDRARRSEAFYEVVKRISEGVFRAINDLKDHTLRDHLKGLSRELSDLGRNMFLEITIVNRHDRFDDVETTIAELAGLVGTRTRDRQALGSRGIPNFRTQHPRVTRAVQPVEFRSSDSRGAVNLADLGRGTAGSSGVLRCQVSRNGVHSPGSDRAGSLGSSRSRESGKASLPGRPARTLPAVA